VLSSRKVCEVLTHNPRSQSLSGHFPKLCWGGGEEGGGAANKKYIVDDIY
jgi:hypothetical protein